MGHLRSRKPRRNRSKNFYRSIAKHRSSRSNRRQRRFSKPASKSSILCARSSRAARSGFSAARASGKQYCSKNLSETSQRSAAAYSVFAGVGERTREGNDLYKEMKESGVIKKTALVFGQMNEVPGARARVALSALTMAEYFRDEEGKNILLFIDNIFRFSQAGAEVSTLLGRMPSAVGYQPTSRPRWRSCRSASLQPRKDPSLQCRPFMFPRTTSRTRRPRRLSATWIQRSFFPARLPRSVFIRPWTRWPRARARSTQRSSARSITTSRATCRRHSALSRTTRHHQYFGH